MEGALLEAFEVVKRYEGAPVNAVNGISLSVAPGEFYSFLGPSGCGKTTLLRIFAGFEEATSGRVLIAGKEMGRTPPYKRPVNMVFQSYALFPHLSVLENVAFGLRNAGNLSRAEVTEQAKIALDKVKLASFSDRMPAQLSGGQQQRVALARALTMRPVVLLLDEPLSALDVQIREEMQDELSRLQRQLNMTFVMVTHDQSEALALSSRVAVFHAGNIEQVGSPKEIYHRPKTSFVASFIGRTNLLPATVLSSGTAGLVELPGGVRIQAAVDSELSGEVNVCFKPEAITIVSREEEGDKLPCLIKNISYQGSHTYLSLALKAAGDTEIRANLPSSQVQNSSLEPGSEAYIKLNDDLCVLAR